MAGREPRPRRVARGALLAAAVVAAAPAATAGDWRVTPRITARENYSDNIRLAPSGFEQDDFVTEIRPGISVRGTGARVVGNLDYDAQALFYANGTRSDRLNNRLQAFGTAELYKDHFFLEGRATIFQENQSNLGRVAGDTINVTGNDRNVYTYRIAPSYRQRFGSQANLFARAAYDHVDNEGGTDSDIYRTEASLTSGSDYTRVPWNVMYNRRRVLNTAGRNSTFRDIDGEVRYNVHRKYGLIGHLGYEDNEISGKSQDTSGVTWRVGGFLNPTERTAFEATYGKRFFGDFWQFDFSHRSRRTLLTASYNEDATTTSTVQADRVVVELTDPFGNPILDPDTGDPLAVPVDTASTTDEVIIRRNFNAGVAFQGRRTDGSIRLFAVHRDFELGGTELFYGVNVSGTRRLSSRTRARLFGRWQQGDLRSGRTDDRFSIGGLLRHNFLQNVNGSFEIRHTRNDSTDPTSEFDETRITGRISMIF